jgi:hypothetical protein
MLFMVVETFRDQNARAVYDRLEARDRLLPDGLTFLHSHVAADLSRCWQLMETHDITLLQQWVAQWADLVAFEIVPVVAGVATRAALKGAS